MTILPLSTFDHIFANDAVEPMQLVLHYRGEPDIARLEASYVATCREFVGAHGVLMQRDEHTLGLDMSREAAEFRVVDSGGPEFVLAECVRPACSELGKPVARMTVTRLGSAGTAIVCSMSHAVSDGYGYFLFQAALFARYRGEPFPAPNCDRDALTTAPAATAVSTKPGKLAHSGFLLAGDWPRPRLRVELRDFAVSELKERPRGDARGSFTRSDYLAALLWKDAMAGEPHGETTFTCAVDLRKHHPSAGPLFFGNASFLASKTVSMQSLRKAAPEEVALWVRAAIDEVPALADAGLAELEALRQQAGVAAMLRLRSVRPDGGFVFSNLSKVALNALDFGAGPPIAITRTSNPTPHERSCGVFTLGDKLRLLISRP